MKKILILIVVGFCIVIYGGYWFIKEKILGPYPKALDNYPTTKRTYKILKNPPKMDKNIPYISFEDGESCLNPDFGVEDRNAAMEEIKSMPVTPNKLFMLCPFTNDKQEITVDSLSLYFPTLFKIAWNPEKALCVPFTPNIHGMAKNWGILKLKKKFTLQDAQSFAMSFGCQDYVMGYVNRDASKIKIHIIFYQNLLKIDEKKLEFNSEKITQIPSQISLNILRKFAADKLSQKNLEFLENPASTNPSILKETTEAIIKLHHVESFDNFITLHNIAVKDDFRDWVFSIYLACPLYQQLPRNEAIRFMQTIEKRYPTSLRIRYFYAIFLRDVKAYRQAFRLAYDLVKEDCRNGKTYQIFADTIADFMEQGELKAAPFYEKMLQMQPNSSYANYIMGRHKVHLAWDYRGSGWSNSVSEDGWKNFYKELQNSKEYLKKSLKIDPNNYLAIVYCIAISKGLGESVKQKTIYFNYALNIDPEDKAAYLEMQESLMPKWGGSLPMLRTFWQDIHKSSLLNLDIYLLPVEAHEEIAENYTYDPVTKKINESYFSEETVWNDIKTAFERYLKSKESPQHRGLLGIYAVRAKKYDFAFKQFETTNMKFQKTSRFPYEEFLKYYASSALYTKQFEKLEQIAKKGLEYNHCNKCNEIFQNYLNLALKKPDTISQTKNPGATKTSQSSSAAESFSAINQEPSAQETQEVIYEGGDGTSMKNAIIIKAPDNGTGVIGEYEWIRKNHPSWKLLKQSLIKDSGKIYDRLDFMTSDGSQKSIYFDITNFFGKW